MEIMYLSAMADLPDGQLRTIIAGYNTNASKASTVLLLISCQGKVKIS